MIHRQRIGNVNVATGELQATEALSPIIFTDTRLKFGLLPENADLAPELIADLFASFSA